MQVDVHVCLFEDDTDFLIKISDSIEAVFLERNIDAKVVPYKAWVPNAQNEKQWLGEVLGSGGTRRSIWLMDIRDHEVGPKDKRRMDEFVSRMESEYPEAKEIVDRVFSRHRNIRKGGVWVAIYAAKHNIPIGLCSQFGESAIQVIRDACPDSKPVLFDKELLTRAVMVQRND